MIIAASETLVVYTSPSWGATCRVRASCRDTLFLCQLDAAILEHVCTDIYIQKVCHNNETILNAVHRSESAWNHGV